MITEWQMIRVKVTAPEPRPAIDPRAHFAAEPAVAMAGARLLVLGCGSVGGLAAWGLAGAGVGELVLADRDRLKPANLRRHVCGPDGIGRSKAESVATWLHGHFPTATTTAHDLCFLERPEDLRWLIADTDAVLVAVDAEGPKHLIDAMARELRKPVVYAGVYGGGWAGEVILSDAKRETPCYACAAGILGREGIPIFPIEISPDYALPAAGRAESEWARADVTSLMPVAAFAARLVVAVLAADQGDSTRLAEFTSRDGAAFSAWRLPVRLVSSWGRPGEIVPVNVAPGTRCHACVRP